jgi:hypothetical protein
MASNSEIQATHSSPTTCAELHANLSQDEQNLCEVLHEALPDEHDEYAHNTRKL